MSPVTTLKLPQGLACTESMEEKSPTRMFYRQDQGSFNSHENLKTRLRSTQSQLLIDSDEFTVMSA